MSLLYWKSFVVLLPTYYFLSTRLCRFNEFAEEWMRFCGTRLKFRMELAAQKPRVIFDFDNFRQTAVRRHAGDAQTLDR